MRRTRRDETFAAARDERLEVSGNPGQYADLQAFVEEQRSMRQLVEGSRLRSIAIDTSERDVARACGEIGDWLEATGGLYARPYS